ncbi:trihelix transcription factor ASR3 [Phoenix dactylifera]|uniref:Trihelix transcription factor ASR3 n=1 Tax=Phoenix dactylifera TaxID=42345 RepID=A0A8B7BXE8_PHODC|nr:trihelix transcription factor ASR3 [Phoenix dactylifera]
MADKSAMFGVVGGEERRREYRKGNWTLNETMVLIEAKKIDNERRMKRSIESEGREGGSSSSSRPSEMRWKWVEDYCWRCGCYRSQNQCNDRWDNLMRDFKKVRAYEMSLGAEEGDRLSYWKLDRHERKERNLPSNLLPGIYEALIEVVDRRGVEGVSGSISNMAELVGDERHMGSTSASMPPVMQHNRPVPTSQGPQPPPLSPTHELPQAQAAGTIDSDDDEHSNSPERKRRRGEGSSSKNSSHKLTSAISKSASILAEAFQAGEEKEERRHNDLRRIEERKAKMEQSKAEISIQSMDGLAAAINQLASSILGSLADKGPAAPK